MLDALLDPFAQRIGRRALAELVLLGSVCGPLGVWIVLYRQSYAAESIAHAALPGLVLASLGGLPPRAASRSRCSRSRSRCGEPRSTPIRRWRSPS